MRSLASIFLSLRVALSHAAHALCEFLAYARRREHFDGVALIEKKIS